MVRIFTILICVFFSESLISQVSTSITLKKESSLVINGSTNISKFKLTLDGKDFPGPQFNFNTFIDRDKITISKKRLSLEVKKFHSGNIIALNGFLDLIKSDKYPTMDIELHEINIYNLSSEIAESTSINQLYYKGVASVKITLTGKTRNYDIPFKTFKRGVELSGIGTIRINIRDFDLIPPVAMLGLVKISEWIDISINFATTIVSDQ